MKTEPEKKTEGPWHTSGVGFPDDPQRRTEWVYGPRQNPGDQSGPLICEVKGPDSAARARLIAAAPELLAAIHALREASSHPESGPNGTLVKCWALVNAAIDKAEGAA